MPRVTFAQQRVAQHGAERGREREGEARFQTVAQPAVEDLEQRQIGFGDALKEPAFLQKLFMLRMPHKGQVRVQDE